MVVAGWWIDGSCSSFDLGDWSGTKGIFRAAAFKRSNR